MEKLIYDVAIVGGGINGTGIAQEAALRGLKVFLCDRGDLAGATSSASSKLIHGGLRYLELHEYGLVKGALQEREHLLHNAQHLVKPLRFILPYQPQLRSRYLIRLGLFLYDHLNFRSSLPKSKSVDLRKHAAGNYLKGNYQFAFEYSDLQVDDSRLVIANALQAKNNGADICNYLECTEAIRQEKFWQLTLKDKMTEQQTSIHARILINATGPFVPEFLQKNAIKSRHQMALIKGSHIVIPRIYQEDFAYILQNEDKRVVFVIPYLEQFHLIGTTDVVFQGAPENPKITRIEQQYLLSAVNRYFSKSIKQTDILHSYSGIRPLLYNDAKNPASITRDYEIEIDEQQHNLPSITIFGGKLTTYRQLAEKTVNTLKKYFPELPASNSAHTVLPGANFKANYFEYLKNSYSWLSEALLQRYLKQYGTQTELLLSNCHNINDLGKNFGNELYQHEIDYLIANEWARTVEDILWRRTKLGYFIPEKNLPPLIEYLKSAEKLN